MKHVLVVGASGLVGRAALEHFATAGRPVTAVSRRAPAELHGARHLALDLNDRLATNAAISELSTVTHLVYAAVQEDADLIAGWTDESHVERNGQMFRNVLDPLERVARDLRHVTALQGPKAYGVHLGAAGAPVREGASNGATSPTSTGCRRTSSAGGSRTAGGPGRRSGPRW